MDIQTIVFKSGIITMDIKTCIFATKNAQKIIQKSQKHFAHLLILDVFFTTSRSTEAPLHNHQNTRNHRFFEKSRKIDAIAQNHENSTPFSAIYRIQIFKIVFRIVSFRKILDGGTLQKLLLYNNALTKKHQQTSPDHHSTTKIDQKTSKNIKKT